jgi:thymidylate synthase (FAD)
MRVKLEELTEDAEGVIARIARVSNPDNQDNPEYKKLIKYCIQKEHWSVFEHSHMTLEIETSLAIATQILRHRSFTFQQFSQRYSKATEHMDFEPIQLRKQAEKNRQSSSGLIDSTLAVDFQEAIFSLLDEARDLYNQMTAMGVAKECARFILPQCTQTRLYMTGNIRSWIHYIQLRSKEETQYEHRIIANAAKKIFILHFPLISEALEWTG